MTTGALSEKKLDGVSPIDFLCLMRSGTPLPSFDASMFDKKSVRACLSSVADLTWCELGKSFCVALGKLKSCFSARVLLRFELLFSLGLVA